MAASTIGSHSEKKHDDMGTNPTEASAKLEATIERLMQLVNFTEAAEELACVWHRSDQETAGRHGPRLRDLKTALDAGKLMEVKGGRGVPMMLVTRTCKAAWHFDGSWPLLGCDEQGKEEGIGAGNLPRSIHQTNWLLRPPGHQSARIPLQDVEQGPSQRPDPSPEEIALTYRRRGVWVAQMDVPANDIW